jgi:hypothetical protein
MDYPEPARQMALFGAELLLVPSAVDAGGPSETLTPLCLLPTRARENGFFVAYSNWCGPTAAPEIEYGGRSAIVCPDGQDLQRAFGPDDVDTNDDGYLNNLAGARTVRAECRSTHATATARSPCPGVHSYRGRPGSAGCILCGRGVCLAIKCTEARTLRRARSVLHWPATQHHQISSGTEWSARF